MIGLRKFLGNPVTHKLTHSFTPASLEIYIFWQNAIVACVATAFGIVIAASSRD
jgi:hypothetical protein